jgi:hypothetical protein
MLYTGKAILASLAPKIRKEVLEIQIIKKQMKKNAA